LDLGPSAAALDNLKADRTVADEEYN